MINMGTGCFLFSGDGWVSCHLACRFHDGCWGVFHSVFGFLLLSSLPSRLRWSISVLIE